MTHRRSRHQHPDGHRRVPADLQAHSTVSSVKKEPGLDIVLRADSAGSLEAVTREVTEIMHPEVPVRIINSGIGDIGTSAVFLAAAADRLVVGFQVGLASGVEKVIRDQQVEVRLYEVMYRLVEDLKNIAGSLAPKGTEEQVIGTGRVIALFKSSRRGIIIGCEVLSGQISLGGRFRIISAMGPVYEGVIESMHRESEAIQKAIPGQKVGIKIRDFNHARIGDLVESYRLLRSERDKPWAPRGEVMRL